jgi:hypothetical protein
MEAGRMMRSMTIYSTDAACIAHSCTQINEKQAAFSQAHRFLNDFPSRIDQYGKKAAGMIVKRYLFGRFGLFRKIHIMESRLTHRPTTG